MNEAPYNYFDTNLLIKEEIKGYEEILGALYKGLEEQAEREEITVEDILEDDQIEIPESAFNGEHVLEPESRFQVEDENRAVYIFNSSQGGIEIIGDYSMLRYALPETVPDEVIPINC